MFSFSFTFSYDDSVGVEQMQAAGSLASFFCLPASSYRPTSIMCVCGVGPRAAVHACRAPACHGLEPRGPSAWAPSHAGSCDGRGLHGGLACDGEPSGLGRRDEGPCGHRARGATGRALVPHDVCESCVHEALLHVAPYEKPHEQASCDAVCGHRH